MNDVFNEAVSEVQKAWANLKEARAMKCTCSGFVIQYQGCSCEKGKRKGTFKELLEMKLDELVSL